LTFAPIESAMLLLAATEDQTALAKFCGDNSVYGEIEPANVPVASIVPETLIENVVLDIKEAPLPANNAEELDSVAVVEPISRPFKVTVAAGLVSVSVVLPLISVETELIATDGLVSAIAFVPASAPLPVAVVFSDSNIVLVPANAEPRDPLPVGVMVSALPSAADKPPTLIGGTIPFIPYPDGNPPLTRDHCSLTKRLSLSPRIRLYGA